MRYRKDAMIVAPQPESTEAGAEILKAGRQCRRCRDGLCSRAGRRRPHDVRHRRLRELRHRDAGKGFHGYIDFHAPAPLAVRPDMWPT